MKAVRTLSAFLYFLCLAEAQNTPVAVQCVDSSSTPRAACAGTLADPCAMNVAAVHGFAENDIVRLDFYQDGYGDPENALCDDGARRALADCVPYEKTNVYGRVSATPPSTGVDIEVALEDIVTICVEGCWDADASGVFNGVCQEAGRCLHAGVADCTVALFQAATPTTQTTLTKISGTSFCATATTSWTDDGKTCTDQEADVCEAMIVGGTVDEIVKLTYSQPRSSDAAQGDLCTDDVRGGVEACEAYSTTTDIFVKVVAGTPTGTEVELSPAAVLALCASPCLDDTDAFSGICQTGEAGVSTCEHPRDNEESVCDVLLWGTLSYESAGPPVEPPTGATSDEGTEEQTVDVTTTTTTTSGANSVMAALSLGALLVAA